MYLDPKTKRFYANRGIPCRRGYLFYGPPGMGKTSFSQAIAGHFGLDIFVIAASDKDVLADQTLLTLFDGLPSRCIVLFENIDPAGISREIMKDEGKSQKDESKIDDTCKKGITLSGLLNAFDGVEAAGGRIVIMTTTEPDSLDSALIRPGRIDSRNLFGYASAHVAAKLFEHIYVRAEDEIPDGESATTDGITALAKQFAASLPANQLTPAELQGYLLSNRSDPRKAAKSAAA